MATMSPTFGIEIEGAIQDDDEEIDIGAYHCPHENWHNGLCVMAAMNLSVAPEWHLPQVAFLFAGYTGDLGSLALRMPCEP